jgi:branched-chain amino acid transport system substrate-binding protein
VRSVRWLAALVVSALLAGCAAGATAPDVEAQDAPIVIGFLGELTGPFATWGIHARNGMQLAIDELNESGGVDGRMLELVERDTQGTPDEATTALRGMIEREGIIAAGGLVSSDVALAAARVAEDEGVPLFLVKAGASSILDTDSHYTFRTCLPEASMNMQMLEQFIVAERITRVGAIVADYAWGRAIEDAIEARIAPLDGVTVQIEVAPVPETDFTGYLRRFRDLEPEILIATGHPPGTAAIAAQAADLGLDAYVVGSNSSTAHVFAAVGRATYDRFVDFTCANLESEAFRQLATRYHERFGQYMEDDAVAGYGQVLMVAEAVEHTGTTAPDELAGYLHANSFDLPGYAWRLGWTEWGELAGARPLLVVFRRQQPPEGVNPGAEWFPQVLFRAEPLEPHRP